MRMAAEPGAVAPANFQLPGEGGARWTQSARLDEGGITLRFDRVAKYVCHGLLKLSPSLLTGPIRSRIPDPNNYALARRKFQLGLSLDGSHHC